MDVINIQHLTKDYGNGKGIFDINISIKKGEMFGFVGTNGAGKTTTLRHIMGFLKPDKGEVKVMGLDAWKQADKVKEYVAYIPGEIAFPDLKNGVEFLKSQEEFYGMKDSTYTNEMLKKLHLDPTAGLKQMSKGMKQKTAIVACFMRNADILILDEPTTGLDPLMRVAFIDIIKQEKAKGKTILMSSHMFEELQETCDRVALIDRGHIVSIANVQDIKNRPFSEFKIEFLHKEDYMSFKKLSYNIVRDQEKYQQVTISIAKDKENELFADLKKYKLKFIAEVSYNLETYFKEKLKEVYHGK